MSCTARNHNCMRCVPFPADSLKRLDMEYVGESKLRGDESYPPGR